MVINPSCAEIDPPKLSEYVSLGKISLEERINNRDFNKDLSFFYQLFIKKH